MLCRAMLHTVLHAHQTKASAHSIQRHMGGRWYSIPIETCDMPLDTYSEPCRLATWVLPSTGMLTLMPFDVCRYARADQQPGGLPHATVEAWTGCSSACM